MPGEDTVVTGRLSQNGVAIVHVASAKASEVVGPERLLVGWVVERFERSGFAWAMVVDELGLGTGRLLLTIAKCALRSGVLFLGLGQTNRQTSVARATAEMARLRGLARGLWECLRARKFA